MNARQGRSQYVEDQAIRVGRWVVVSPIGSTTPADPNLIPIQIEPGAAFGSGTHPTTRLCVAALERHLSPGDSVLDLGTGTGILSIAAAKLGAHPILGLDIDLPSVEVAQKNVTANQVGDSVQVEQGSLVDILDGRDGFEPASVVVVNILANVILSFFEQGLTDVVRPGGLLILSGILRAQTPEVIVRLRWHGLDELAREQADDWTCFVARHPLK